MEAIENNILRNALAIGEFAAGDFDVAGKFGSVEELVQRLGCCPMPNRWADFGIIYADET